MQTTSDNPLIRDTVIPGHTVRLPSRGLYYKRNELAESVKDGELMVYPMTYEDELVFKSIDNLFSGESLRQVIARRCPQVKKPGQLLAKDVDYLVVQLRKVSYGDSLSIDYRHNCTDAKNHTYNFSITEQMLSTGVELTSAESLDLPLDNGQVVHFTHARFDDMIALLQASNSELSAEDQRNRELDGVLSVIEGVTMTTGEKIVDRNHVGEWLTTIPRQWMVDVVTKIGKLSNWGIDSAANIECLDCKEMMRISVPINPISFFT